VPFSTKIKAATTNNYIVIPVIYTLLFIIHNCIYRLHLKMSKKNVLYVGGLSPQVTEEILQAAFIPFGDIRSIQIPKEYSADKSKGFGFVEFESDEDCAAALENMDGAELYARVLRCTIAKPMGNKGGKEGKAVWSSEEWMQKQLQLDTQEVEEGQLAIDN
jgi:peptidyl-prolyl isomerase E (cyclophilin E)